MDKVKILSRFFQFLLEHHCAESFYNNVIADGQDFTQFLSVISPSDYISSAFTWAETDEGHRYWRELAIKWRQVIYELNLINIKRRTQNEKERIF